MQGNGDTGFVDEFNRMFEENIWPYWESMEARVKNVYSDVLQKVFVCYRDMAPFNVLRKTVLQAREAYDDLRSGGVSQHDAWQKASKSLADFVQADMSPVEILLEDDPIGQNLETYRRLANWKSFDIEFNSPRFFEFLYHSPL